VAASLDTDRHLPLQPPPGTRVRTLLVDDSRAVRDGLSQLLDMQPYFEVVGAVADPVVALEHTRAVHPDVVLQDFSMPGVDPFRLIRDLTACAPAPAVLVVSATADEHSARQAMDAGALGWVLKDAEPEELFAALLGAAGFGAHAQARVVRSALDDAGPPLDARTVWALLRVLEEEPAGLSPEEAAGRAVLPVASTVRYLQRLSARRPALVAGTRPGSPCGRYVLMAAGRREIERLERRIPAHAAPAPAAV
jgi:DNA-binding NarL/FixJ family response regulator